MTTTTEATRVTAPPGAVGEWIALGAVASKIFGPAAAGPDQDPAAAELAAGRAAVVADLGPWSVRVRVLPYPEAKALESRHAYALAQEKAADTGQGRAAAARELAESEIEIIRAGLVEIRHGEGQGEPVDAARVDDVARWAHAWLLVHVIKSYNSLQEADRAAFFTPAPGR